jgi:hypothetical protein
MSVASLGTSLKRSLHKTAGLARASLCLNGLLVPPQAAACHAPSLSGEELWSTAGSLGCVADIVRIPTSQPSRAASTARFLYCKPTSKLSVNVPVCVLYCWAAGHRYSQSASCASDKDSILHNFISAQLHLNVCLQMATTTSKARLLGLCQSKHTVAKLLQIRNHAARPCSSVRAPVSALAAAQVSVSTGTSSKPRTWS